MKKFFSLVLALVMALSLTTVAWGAEPTVFDDVDTNAELAAALKDTVAEEVVINLSAAPTDSTEKFTIDLYNNVNPAIKNLTINGTNYTKVCFANLQVRAELFNELTINDCEILRMPDKGWGHLVFGGSKAGGVYTISNCLFNGAGSQGIYFNPISDATWVVEECEFNGDFGAEGAVVLQNNSVPTDLSVENNDFDVAAGSEELTIHYHKEALTLNADVDETVLIWNTGNFESAVATAEAGDTFKLMGDVDLTSTPVEITTPINIDDNGKTLTGLAAGSDITTDANGKITGGTFNTDVSAYLSPSAGFVTNPDGSVAVGAKAASGTYNLYSCNNTVVAVTTGLSYTKVAASQSTDGTGTIAYVSVNNGKNYMEISAAEATKADFYLTNAGASIAVMYLREVTTVVYTATAAEFTNFGYACGQYTKQYGDTKAYYQVLTGANAGKVYAEGTGGATVLVGDEVVTLAATNVNLNAHVWSTTAVDSTTGVPTAAICAKCSTLGTVYASTDKVPASATIDATKLLYNSVQYPVVAGYKASTPVVTPSTDKTVTSADTFDAGIAMYVGMSVMAAAGGAVVIGKKRED